jgi:hypothetical protein
MDTVENYRNTIEKVLTDYASIPYSHGEIETRCVFDRQHDQYLLKNVGWNNNKRVDGCVVHLEMINGKIWIQEDNTEYGIATDLELAGVPKSDIVLGFQPPELRKYTDYAVA